MTSTETLTIDARTFNALVNPVIPFASADVTFPLLASLRIDRRGDWLVAAATDRYRLAMKRVPLFADALEGEAPDTFTAVVRAADLRRIQKLWRPTRTENPMLILEVEHRELEGDRLVVRSAGTMVDFDEARVAFVLPDGPYPPIDRLLVDALKSPTVADRAVRLNPRLLARPGRRPGARRADRHVGRVGPGR